MPANNNDLTARLNALREVLVHQIQTAQESATARMDSQDMAREQYLNKLDSEHAGLRDQIRSLRELQETLHEAMAKETKLRADELAASVRQRTENLAEQTRTLAAGVQLQIDQRFEAADHATQLIQEEIDQRMAAMKDLMDERHAAQIRSFEEQRDAAMNSVQAALESSKLAVGKAEAATEKRFDAVNEFRQSLADQTATFPTRTEIGVQIDNINSTTTRNTTALRDLELRLTSRLDTMNGQNAGALATRIDSREDRNEQKMSTAQMLQTIAIIIVGLGVVISIIALVLHK